VGHQLPAGLGAALGPDRPAGLLPLREGVRGGVLRLAAEAARRGPGDIDCVVFSHLHFDHAGNAQLFKETNARLVCSAAEKEWAFGFEGPFNGAHLKTDYQGLDFETVSGDEEFLPGISFIQTPGHTPGSMSMRVDLPETGTMIFTADAVYMGASYGPPVVPAAMVNNLEQFYSSVEKLRGIATKADATVVFGHDPDQIKQLRVAPMGSYR
jgi:N-acyl homoserine lactone hydrolase